MYELTKYFIFKNFISTRNSLLFIILVFMYLFNFVLPEKHFISLNTFLIPSLLFEKIILLIKRIVKPVRIPWILNTIRFSLVI